MKTAEGLPKGYKTLWEKEKLLVTSIFLFSLSVFKRLVLQTRKNRGLFGKMLKKRDQNEEKNDPSTEKKHGKNLASWYSVHLQSIIAQFT